MAYRRHYRKRSKAGRVLADATYIANRLSWFGAAVLGVISFAVLYWLIPAWLNHKLNSLEGNTFYSVVEVLFARRIHWFQWVGIVLGLICAFFAIRNYVATQKLGRDGEGFVSFFGRLLARWLD